MWLVAALACCVEKEDGLRALLALGSRMEEAALARLQELVQDCRDARRGVKPSCWHSSNTLGHKVLSPALSAAVPPLSQALSGVAIPAPRGPVRGV
jgi:hypothetical protein